MSSKGCLAPKSIPASLGTDFFILFIILVEAHLSKLGIASRAVLEEEGPTESVLEASAHGMALGEPSHTDL